MICVGSHEQQLYMSGQKVVGENKKGKYGPKLMHE